MYFKTEIRLSFILAIALLWNFAIYAQEDQKSDPSEQFANTITKEDYFTHISFLADDLLEGRSTGERGQQLAGHYIKTHFMRLGLKPGVPSSDSYYQPYELSRTNDESGNFTIGKKGFTFGEDYLAWSGGQPDNLDGEWIFGGYGIEDESYNNLENLDVKDKIVLLLGGEPAQLAGDGAGNLMSMARKWRGRSSSLKEKGARAAILAVDKESIDRMSRFIRRTSLSMSKENEALFNFLLISNDMADQLLRQLKTSVEKQEKKLEKKADPDDLNLAKLKYQYEANVKREKIIPTNVLGYLEGTDKKDELVVITGHYDHVGVSPNGDVFNGADDDASGTTAVLEIAEAFALAAEAGYRPRRSMLFMTVSGEEIGLLGSRYYTDNPVFPLEKTVANLNIDMIGRVGSEYEGDPDALNYIYIIGSDYLSTDLHNIGEYANTTYTKLKLDYKYNDKKDPNRFYYRSDHYNFAKHGIPIIFYFNGTHADYHKTTDTIDKIELSKAVKITRLVFHTAWELANREDRPVVDKPIE